MDRFSFYRSRIERCVVEARRATSPAGAAIWRAIRQDYEYLLQFEQATASCIIGQTTPSAPTLRLDQASAPITGADLAEARQAIADSEKRIEELRNDVQQLAADGYSTEPAEAALAERGRGLWHQRTLLFELRKHLNLTR